jgi:hypothetical protein
VLLSEARSRYSRLAGNGLSLTERLNQVIQRLLPEADARGTTVPVRFVVYEDNSGNAIVTLGRELEAIRSGAYQASDPNQTDPGTFWCGKPLPVQNQWYETAAEGPGVEVGSNFTKGFIRLPGRFTTFADWDESMRLRIKLETDESPGGSIIFRGTLNGARIFTAGSGRDIEGVALAYTNATVTTTQRFDRPPYSIIKPKTKARIKLYAVDEDDVETLVGWYDPDETNPSYARYKVPVCPATTT